MRLVWPVLAGLLTSTAALIGSALILAKGEEARRVTRWLLAFAIGTLLAAAMLDLLPEALEHGDAERAMMLFLAGIIGFIVMERFLRWRHPHERHLEAHEHAATHGTAAMILWSDALHNFIDGLVLGVAFGADVRLGAATALAVFAHEVPQEIGDFAILLESGMPRRRALVLNYLAALTPVPAAVIAFLWSSASRAIIPWLLPIAAGGFVYIALAGLVPALHHRRSTGTGLGQTALIAVGIAVVWVIGRVTGHGA